MTSGDRFAYDTASWLAEVAGASYRKLADQLATKQILIGREALEKIAVLLAGRSARPQNILLLADPDTFDAAGRRVGDILRREGHAVAEAITAASPHADDRTIDCLLEKLDLDPQWIVAVGSGTISDIGKVLAQHSKARLLTVATAASMNGYTSPIAAISVNGLKTTRASHPADVLLMDLDVIAAAPIRMTRAGFGDLLSKPVSGADWRLSSFFFGTKVEPVALSLVDDAVQNARRHSDAIGRGEIEGIASLCDALILSGFSMSLAGSSCPASGGEHLISHYRDMSFNAWGLPAFLHGEQVAVATLCSLEIYRRLESLGPPSEPHAPPADDDLDAASSIHAHLGRNAFEALLAEARAKQALVPDRRARRASLARNWQKLWSRLEEQLARGRNLKADLERAGCPTSFDDIDTPPHRAKHLIIHARQMRSRYTVLDLAADLGHLERFAEELIAARTDL